MKATLIQKYYFFLKELHEEIKTNPKVNPRKFAVEKNVDATSSASLIKGGVISTGKEKGVRTTYWNSIPPTPSMAEELIRKNRAYAKQKREEREQRNNQERAPISDKSERIEEKYQNQPVKTPDPERRIRPKFSITSLLWGFINIKTVYYYE